MTIQLPLMPAEVLKDKTAFFLKALEREGYDGSGDPTRPEKLARFMAEYDTVRDWQPRTKGLRLVGQTGRGKTFFFEIFRKYFPQVEIVSLPLAVRDFARCGMSRFDEGDCRWSPVVIDDLGREAAANYMGTKFDITPIILQREQAWRRGILTFFTTELSTQEIATRYGAHVASRISAMSDVIECKGGCRR